ncbi:putative hydro-lyase [Bosea sp. NPDC055332]
MNERSSPAAALSEARRQIRSGAYRGQTGTLARGFVQANIVILPAAYAADFLAFCQRNPKPCPLLAMGRPGDPSLPSLGEDIDMRSDVPAYRVVENGRETAVVHDITDLWRDDLVTFALGCSFSFEEAIEEAGLGIRHNELGLVNPMYTTNIATAPAGPFKGPIVVTMRPFTPAKAIRAIQITSRFPQVHGAPIHFGDPAAIGIADLARAEYGGDAVPIHDGEVPLFWACGVTSQLAVEQAGLPFCITHKPASMLITDRRNAEFSVF